MANLKELLDEHVRRLRSLNYSIATIRARFYNVRSLLAWLRQTYDIADAEKLQEKHLRAWQLKIGESRTRRGLPVCPRTVNKKIECVRAFLDDLRRVGVVRPGMVSALEYVKVPRLLPRVLPHREIRGMLTRIDTTSAEGQRDRTMLELLYSSGLRAAELLSMDVQDIDFNGQTALVKGKGRKERIVPVGATALRHLESYTRAVRAGLLGHSHEAALFLDRRGKRLPYHTFRRIVLRVAQSAGLAGEVTAHVFRRSCTSELIKGNANIYHVSRMLGHESVDTLKYYVKLNIGDLRRTHHRTHPRERDERRRGA